MATGWEKTKLIALPKDEWTGKGRSVLGYAAESLVIGRALVCGYGLFFRAWRDYKCDAILDHRGSTYRIEIKGTSGGDQLSVTGGGRSGSQISREAASREQLVSKVDVDFVFGVHTLSGRSWIIPVEVIELLGSKSLNLSKVAAFEESWGIFLFPKTSILGPRGLNETLMEKSEAELISIAHDIGARKIELRHSFAPRMTHTFSSSKEALVFSIWEAIGLSGQYLDD